MKHPKNLHKHKADNTDANVNISTNVLLDD